MRVPRIYTPRSLTTGAMVELDGVAANHITRVLRLQTGAALTLFNGLGGEYAATLHHVGKTTCTAAIGEHRARECESPLEIELAQGVSRGERMDFVIQKSVELGVRRIVPVWTSRSQVHLSGSRLEQRLGHWRGVVAGACEQCGRNTLPEVVSPLPLHGWIATQPATVTRFVLCAEGGQPLCARPASGTRICLLIGPEGGLAPEERSSAVAAGFIPLRLGPRVLRTETAALAALAALQSVWGDFRS